MIANLRYCSRLLSPIMGAADTPGKDCITTMPHRRWGRAFTMLAGGLVLTLASGFLTPAHAADAVPLPDSEVADILFGATPTALSPRRGKRPWASRPGPSRPGWTRGGPSTI